jgi:hypothetical protein
MAWSGSRSDTRRARDSLAHRTPTPAPTLPSTGEDEHHPLPQQRAETKPPPCCARSARRSAGCAAVVRGVSFGYRIATLALAATEPCFAPAAAPRNALPGPDTRQPCRAPAKTPVPQRSTRERRPGLRPAAREARVEAQPARPHPDPFPLRPPHRRCPDPAAVRTRVEGRPTRRARVSTRTVHLRTRFLGKPSPRSPAPCRPRPARSRQASLPARARPARA